MRKIRGVGSSSLTNKKCVNMIPTETMTKNTKNKKEKKTNALNWRKHGMSGKTGNQKRTTVFVLFCFWGTALANTSQFPEVFTNLLIPWKNVSSHHYTKTACE